MILSNTLFRGKPSSFVLNGWDLYDPEREFARQEVNYFVVARELFKLGFLVFRDLLVTVFNFLKTTLIFIQGFSEVYKSFSGSRLLYAPPEKNRWVVPPVDILSQLIVLYKRIQHL